MKTHRKALSLFLALFSVLSIGCVASAGDSVDDGAAVEEDTPGDEIGDDTTATAALALTHCTDVCNPGVYQGKRWSCKANRSLPTGYSCSSGWETCVPGCNAGHFDDTLWSCSGSPWAHTGTSCPTGWQLCNPEPCEASLGINVCDRPSDGCSSPISSPYNSKFRNACNEHDRCYSTPGKSKSSCDSEFLDDMIDTCFYLDLACLGAANTYAGAVAFSPQGQEAYDDSQAAVANCTTVLDHGRIFYP